ncbi:MAG TPA: hypothetical protein VIK91_19640 [Nannocystis sp.]
MSRVALAVVTALALVVCGDSRGAGLTSGFGVTSASQGSGSTGGSSSGSSSSSTGEVDEDSAGNTSSSGAGMLDVGTPPDFGPVQPPGCKGKIDFLFLISSFYTMKTEQEQLLASLPGFFDTITATFPDFDLRIMVANAAGSWAGWVCEQPHLCGQNGTCGETAEDYVCGPDTWLTVTKCDETLGAGLTFNAGSNATNKRCELAEGRFGGVAGRSTMRAGELAGIGGRSPATSGRVGGVGGLSLGTAPRLAGVRGGVGLAER